MTLISDQQSVSMVTQVMAGLEFRLSKLHRSHMRGTQFTDLIIYSDDKSGDWVDVSCPNESTIQARFKNRIDSPVWNSLEEFEEKVGIWMQKCRSTN